MGENQIKTAEDIHAHSIQKQHTTDGFAQKLSNTITKTMIFEKKALNFNKTKINSACENYTLKICYEEDQE